MPSFPRQHRPSSKLARGSRSLDRRSSVAVILNNRYGIDAHAATATAWNTSIRYYGGHFACGT
ncbi:MAG: hypothetical protein ACKO4X_08560 [Alphaproteobacteria bacterium]